MNIYENENVLLSEKENVNLLLRNSSHRKAFIDVKRKKELRRRLIFKNGDCNIIQPQSNHRYVFLQFTKMLDYGWLWTITLFTATLLVSWFGFAVLWWLICFSHGDFEPEHLPPVQKINNFQPCVYHIHNFASCFLFSIETQHTVGYGVKATTEECPEAIFLNATQCIIGFIMQGLMAVIIFAKMTLPSLRSKTLMFSKKAVICERDGQLCFMFRIGDIRKKHIIDANVRAQFVKTVRTIEGEILPNHQTQLKLDADGSKAGLFFNWPLIMVHVIDANSPFYQMSPNDLAQNRFEIVVVLEGTIECTGQSTQTKSSYITSEISWGHKFAPLLNFNSDRAQYEADFSKFNLLVPSETPLCSAAYIDDWKNDKKLPRPSITSLTKSFVDDRIPNGGNLSNITHDTIIMNIQPE